MRRFRPTFESYFLLFDLIKEELKEDDRKCYRYADMIYPTILGAKRPFQIKLSVRPCASQLGSSLSTSLLRLMSNTYISFYSAGRTCIDVPTLIVILQHPMFLALRLVYIFALKQSFFGLSKLNTVCTYRKIWTLQNFKILS